jgi:hypothetical protein
LSRKGADLLRSFNETSASVFKQSDRDKIVGYLLCEVLPTAEAGDQILLPEEKLSLVKAWNDDELIIAKSCGAAIISN